ncbi:hypothetical protein HN903_01795 [archaeon]|jgi:hypothetical protein|nr:hypothetical protein [archaeon]MBT6956473.1 hypothetical protein [archaeon]MBT7128466.1 hypothetical protein [archaeon]
MNFERKIESIFDQVEAIWPMIKAMIESGQLTEEAVTELLDGPYEELVATYRPLLPILPMIISKLVMEFQPMVLPVRKLKFQLQSNPAWKKMQSDNYTLKAETRKEIFAAYMSKDFTREEAWAMMMEDTTPVKPAQASNGNAFLKGYKAAAESSKEILGDKKKMAALTELLDSVKEMIKEVKKTQEKPETQPVTFPEREDDELEKTDPDQEE